MLVTIFSSNGSLKTLVIIYTWKSCENAVEICLSSNLETLKHSEFLLSGFHLEYCMFREWVLATFQTGFTVSLIF